MITKYPYETHLHGPGLLLRALSQQNTMDQLLVSAS